MLITTVLFATDLEILDEVLEVLKGPADTTREATLIARAVAALDTGDVRRPR